jgi:carbon starvation protein CstA
MILLILGGALYGKFCERVMKPDDRRTPAYTRGDGVDFVPMKTWKNSLINLLNIAGIGLSMSLSYILAGVFAVAYMV